MPMRMQQPKRGRPPALSVVQEQRVLWEYWIDGVTLGVLASKYQVSTTTLRKVTKKWTPEQAKFVAIGGSANQILQAGYQYTF